MRLACAVPHGSRAPYLEPHHTRRLSDGGPDDYHHVIALSRRATDACITPTTVSYNAELRLKLSLEP